MKSYFTLFLLILTACTHNHSDETTKGDTAASLSAQDIKSVGGSDAAMELLFDTKTETKIVPDWALLREYHRRAENNDVTAQYILGLMLQNISMERAQKQFAKAAAQGHLKAAKKLGSKRYLKLLKQQNNQGNTQATLALAHLYYQGEDVPQNFGKAYQLYQQIIEKSSEAKFSSALMQLNGQGVKQNVTHAKKTLQQMAVKKPDFTRRLSWILCTTNDNKVRDGNTGLHLMKSLPETLTQYQFLETLAACYADTGHFDQAIQLQLSALKNTPEQSQEQLLRLSLYQSDQAYTRYP